MFAIKYLRIIGFTVTNDLFADHSWYFRNALVRANYNDYKANIYATFEYLNHFFGNLLLGENTPLKNRDLRISSNKTDVPINVPISVPINVPIKRKDEIIKQLFINPNLTVEELATIFSVADKTIKRDFVSLKNEGKIKRIGSNKAGRWEIIE